MSNKLAAQNAHSLLLYMMSNAAETGKVGSGHILVPFEALVSPDAEEDPTANGLYLKVSIEVDWRAADDVDLEEDYNLELTDVQDIEPEESELENGPEEEPRSGSTSNKNKKSH